MAVPVILLGMVGVMAAIRGFLRAALSSPKVVGTEAAHHLETAPDRVVQVDRPYRA